MKRTYKVIASRGTEIVFDDRIDAESPREARERMKELLGLKSLSGIVYTITELPVDLIRQLVDARVAEIIGGAAVTTPAPADLTAAVAAHLAPILRRLEALEQQTCTSAPAARFDPLASLPPVQTEPEPEPAQTEAEPEPDGADVDEPPPGLNWTQIKSHLRRFRRPDRTAELYGISLHQLDARATAEGWNITTERRTESA
jgi:hypothetical protein